jgi:hypothetical protein
MVLALRIVGAVYILALAMLGGFLLGALRRSSSSRKPDRRKSNIIPFRSARPRSAGAQARDS